MSLEDFLAKASEFRRGQILEATNRHEGAGVHYIIYFQPFQFRRFIGAMITHSGGSNIAMNAAHFLRHDAQQRPFKVQYEQSHLVKAKLIKLEEWGPFTPVGELSTEGIAFVEEQIGKLPAVTWEQYLRKSSRG